MAPPEERKPEKKMEDNLISKGARTRPLFDPEIIRSAIRQSFVKLNPRVVAKNPVMFVVEVGAALTTIFVIKDGVTGATANLGFGIQISLWLWFTVLFANFAEAMAEARGKAQADNLRKTKTDTIFPEGRSTWCRLQSFARVMSSIVNPPISFLGTAR
jgi:K+-transporting ATPase ATPase B chain